MMVFKNKNIMSRICQLTGKKRMVGNNVSHANNKSKRVFNPNLIKKKFYIPSEDCFVFLKVSAKANKSINKLGIEAALKKFKVDFIYNEK